MSLTFSLPLGLRIALAVFLVTAIGTAMADTPQPLDSTGISREPIPSGIQGMWVWSPNWISAGQGAGLKRYNPDWISTKKVQDELLDFCERFGFNRIFVQIHPDSQTADYTIKYPKELTLLVAEATARGIAVEALDGHHSMGLAKNHARTLEKLAAIIDLNQSMPEGKRFVGMHYDIEPYLGEPWKASQESRDIVMVDLLAFYVKARQMLNDRGSKMTLASDIPMWYDTKTAEGNHCIVTFQGQTKNLHQHIQDLCDYVGIMSYRQHALGHNSASFHIANELAYAETIGKKICAALETIELKDTPHITFYEKTPGEFWEQVNLLNQHHADRPGYGGVFLHSYRGLRDLLLDEQP